MDGRLKKKIIKDALTDTAPGECVPFEEYRKYMIITEKSGRVVVADRGLYAAEFDSIEKARDYIDSLR